MPGILEDQAGVTEHEDELRLWAELRRKGKANQPMLLVIQHNEYDELEITCEPDNNPTLILLAKHQWQMLMSFLKHNH